MSKEIKNRLSNRTIVLIVALITITTCLLPLTANAQEEEKYFFEIEAMIIKGPEYKTKFAAVVADEFKKIGIKMNWVVVDGSVNNERQFKSATQGVTAKDGGYDVEFGGFGMGGPADPDSLMVTQTSNARWPGGWNIWNWQHYDIDRLFQEGSKLQSREERQPIYNEIQEIWADECQVIPIAYTITPWFMTEDLGGFDPVRTTANGVADWYFEGEEGGTLRMSYNLDPVKFYPYWGNIGADLFAYDVYERLVDFDAEYNLMPSLAQSWEVSDDGLVFTFHLYENVTWHDGVPFTAEDVVFTYEGFMNKETATTVYTRFNDLIDYVEAPDDYTFVCHLKTYAAGVWGNIFASGLIAPKHLLEDIPLTDWQFSDLANKLPIGTGPFKFDSHEPQQFLKLVANEEYYRGRPELDVRLNINIPDANTALAALEKGDVDIINGAGLGDEIDRVKDVEGLRVTSQLRTSPFIIGPNHEHPILNNKYVRKAMSAAIPRERLVNDVLEGQGIVGTAIINELFWIYNSSISVPTYDIEQAKAYMEMAGYDYAYLEPAPTTPVSELLMYAVAGVVVGLIVGFVASRYIKS